RRPAASHFSVRHRRSGRSPPYRGPADPDVRTGAVLMIRASDLAGKCVRRESGEVLGYVFEIRIRNTQVAALICGSRGFFQRLTGAVTGHRVEWKQVRKITPTEILVADGPTRTM